MTVRVGVIGTGIMGTDHARILHRFVSGAAVTRLTDVDPRRAGEVAATIPGSSVVGDGLALIADPEVDAVVIASSDATHPELATAAVAAGKPVLCEKPLAPTLAGALGVLRAVADRESLLCLGFMRRFDPGYVELKEALRSRACGQPLLVHCVSRGVTSGPGSTSESSVTNSAVHEFDTVPWLLDSPVVEVSWQAPRSSPGAIGLQDPQVMLLRTADGVLTTMETFLNARYGYDIRCEVVGEDGAVSLAVHHRTVRDGERARAVGYAADWRPRFADAYRLELQAWIDAVTAGTRPPLATAQDGLTAAAVADAVITSMHAGGVWTGVRVPEV